MSTVERLDEAGDFIRDRLGSRARPRGAVVLGSGLGRFAEELDEPHAIPYGEIPGFPRATVRGHAGKLVSGNVRGAA
ncbi:purine-nucleoside phosphorylase, partial [bacterium]|nr:purine-nucleoside phosphorylase [bacterium]